MRNAFREVCRNVTHACHFHFAQAVKKNAYTHGLQPALSSDGVALNLYQRFQSLPLLPASYIGDTYQRLAAEVLDMDTYREEWANFIKYSLRQWIKKELADVNSPTNALRG